MQKSYKPFHIVLFILACLIVLGVVTFALPSGRKDIFGYEFRFLSQNKLLKNEVRNEVNIDSLFVDIDTSIVDEVEQPVGKVKNYKISRSEEHTSELQSRPHLVCRL